MPNANAAAAAKRRSTAKTSIALDTSARDYLRGERGARARSAARGRLHRSATRTAPATATTAKRTRFRTAAEVKRRPDELRRAAARGGDGGGGRDDADGGPDGDGVSDERAVGVGDSPGDGDEEDGRGDAGRGDRHRAGAGGSCGVAGPQRRRRSAAGGSSPSARSRRGRRRPRRARRRRRGSDRGAAGGSRASSRARRGWRARRTPVIPTWRPSRRPRRRRAPARGRRPRGRARRARSIEARSRARSAAGATVIDQASRPARSIGSVAGSPRRSTARSRVAAGGRASSASRPLDGSVVVIAAITRSRATRRSGSTSGARSRIGRACAVVVASRGAPRCRGAPRGPCRGGGSAGRCRARRACSARDAGARCVEVARGDGSSLCAAGSPASRTRSQGKIGNALLGGERREVVLGAVDERANDDVVARRRR